MTRTIFQLTPETTRNPFYTNLRHDLESRGFRVLFGVDLEAIETACREDPDGSLVHVHQLEALYQDRDHEVATDRARRLVNFMISIRVWGVPLVHTLHNRRRHDQKQSDLERYTLHMLMAMVTKIIVLGQGARDSIVSWKEVREDLAARVEVVPHQSFVGSYGPRIERGEARRRLALDEGEILFLSLGDLKPYKGHELIIEGFAKAGLPKARLLIVGGGAPGVDHIRALEQRLGPLGAERSRLVAGSVHEDLMACWLSAADFAVYGFKDILMSGSVMLALSYGLPVIVPKMGCLREYVVEGRNGFLYEPSDAVSLGETIHRAVEQRLSSKAVIESLEPWSPERVASALSRVYEDAMATRLERAGGE